MILCRVDFLILKICNKKLYVPLEVTKQTLFELGELGLVEFRDVSDHGLGLHLIVSVLHTV